MQQHYILTSAGAYLLDFHRTPGILESSDRNHIHPQLEVGRQMLWWLIIRHQTHAAEKKIELLVTV